MYPGRATPEAEHKQRHAQLGVRVREMCDTLVAVRDIAAREEGDANEPADMQLARLLLHGLLDVSCIVAAGHSFGGATAVVAAATAAAATPAAAFTAVVALDPWMMPLSAVTLARGMASVPLLALTGEGYAAWRANAVAVALLVDGATRARFLRTGAAADASAQLNVAGSNGVARDGTVLAPAFFTADARVHPGSAAVALRGIEHHAFNDFAVLAERLMRLRSFIGRRSGADGVRVVVDVVAHFVAHTRRARSAVGAGTGATGARAGGAGATVDSTTAAAWTYKLPSELLREAMPISAA